MTSLDDCIHALCGRGVSLCAESSCKLNLITQHGNLQAHEVQPIKANKGLIMLLLPMGYEVTARDFENVLECYREREAMLINGGMDAGSAGLQAIAPARTFLLSLLS
ncbi:MAG TPA: hypothetical protein EYP39_09580 [Ghiorsea sp.]|nr:hypothetical protein [Ghiorsea sp.]